MNSVCIPRVYRRIELGMTESQSSIIPLETEQNFITPVNRFKKDDEKALVFTSRTVLAVVNSIKILEEEDDRLFLFIGNVGSDILGFNFDEPPVWNLTSPGELITGMLINAAEPPRQIIFQRGSAPKNSLYVSIPPTFLDTPVIVIVGK